MLFFVTWESDERRGFYWVRADKKERAARLIAEDLLHTHLHPGTSIDLDVYAEPPNPQPYSVTEAIELREHFQAGIAEDVEVVSEKAIEVRRVS